MPETRILNSWKEISNYVGRGVRTVQRWEQLYGLPVHRAAGKDRSAVYALSEEIDDWLKMGKMHEAKPSNNAARYADLMDRVAVLEAELRGLLEVAATLREEIEKNAPPSSNRVKRTVGSTVTATQRLVSMTTKKSA